MIAQRSEQAAEIAIDVHARILVDLDRTARQAEALNPTEPDPTDFARVLAQVGELRATLTEHFRAEESADLYGRLAALLPDAGADLVRLRQEHGAVLGELDTLLAEVSRCSPLNAERLSRSLAGLLETLFTHEAIEDQLMTRAFGSDASRQRRQTAP